jgi:hypothetical protein
MYPEDEEILDVASSSASEPDDAQQPLTSQESEPQTALPAESSTAKDEPEKTSLSVVRDVIDKSRKAPDEVSSADGEEKKVEEKATKTPDNENYSDVPFNKHPRFRQLLQEKKASERDAHSYQNIQRFMDEKGLSAEEASEALIIGAMAKTDPRGAWDRIKPWVQSILVAAGEVLPQSLQERVQVGELSQEAALELSRAQATAQSMEAAQSFQQQLKEKRQLEARTVEIRNSAIDWESDRRIKDPNFEAKFEHIQAQIALLQRRDGVPSDPEGVRAQLSEAYKRVNATGVFTPALPPTRQRPVIQPVRGGVVSGTRVPAGASTLDIIRAHRGT